MKKSDGGTFKGACQRGRRLRAGGLQHQDRQRPLLRRHLQGRDPGGRAHRLSVPTRWRRPWHPRRLHRRRQRRRSSQSQRTLLRQDLRGGAGGQDRQLQGVLHQRHLPGLDLLHRRLAERHRPGDRGRCRCDQLLDQQQRRSWTTRSTRPSCPRPRQASSSPPRPATAGRVPSTLDHVAPWVTTVAASTVEPYAATVVLGNGKKYAGISTMVQKKVGPAPLVPAAKVKTTGATAARRVAVPRRTRSDPAKAAGKIVVCDRGVDTRVEKSDEVKRAGGRRHGAGQPD